MFDASDWPELFSGLDQAGLYVWVVDKAGAKDLSAGLGSTIKPGRLYAGQIGGTQWPTGRPSTSTLKSGVYEKYLDGRIARCTFRLSIAAALMEPLGLEVIGPKRLTPESEVKVSEWMEEHLRLVVHPISGRDMLEDLRSKLANELDPPLNLIGMPDTKVRAKLAELRLVVGDN